MYLGLATLSSSLDAIRCFREHPANPKGGFLKNFFGYFTEEQPHLPQYIPVLFAAFSGQRLTLPRTDMPPLPPPPVQEVCSTGDALSTAVEVTLPTDEATLESLEGMLVSVQSPVVTENYNAGQYGEITVAAERQWQFTQVRVAYSPVTPTGFVVDGFLC